MKKGIKIALISLIIPLVALMNVSQVYGYNLSGTFIDLDSTLRNYSEYEGDFVFLEAMATDCHFCWDEHVDITRMYEIYGTEVTFISVTVWTTQTQEEVDQYVIDYPTPWIMGRDSGGLRTTYGIQGTPTMFLLDKAGNVIQRFDGYTDKSILSYYFELHVRGNTLATLPALSDDNSGGSNNQSIIGQLFQNPIFQMSTAFIVIIGIYVRSTKRN